MSTLDIYREMNDDELRGRVAEVKARLGKRLTILGHYYQQDSVIAFADHEGDSFELSRFAANAESEFIVFCGVRFMAEAARILARPQQRVFLPDLEAGCPLADMADIERVETAWKAIADKNDIVPIAYMNSDAEVKAFCGEKGGLICTSSSASKAFSWARSQGKRIFFLPDENLGRNTACSMGLPGESIRTWDPLAPSYAKQAEGMKTASLIVWKGHCHVHTAFTPEQVKEMRSQYPGCTIAVHPECSPEVVRLSDHSGSTSLLKRLAEEAAPGSTVVIGTEINFVNRLAARFPEKRILPLARSLCPNMFRTSLADLALTLEHLGEVNEIQVRPQILEPARVALERMLTLPSKDTPTV